MYLDTTKDYLCSITSEEDLSFFQQYDDDPKIDLPCMFLSPYYDCDGILLKLLNYSGIAEISVDEMKQLLFIKSLEN